MHEAFLDHEAVSKQFEGLPDVSLYPSGSVPSACNWAYVTERVLLVHLTEVKGSRYTSYLYTMVTYGNEETVDVEAVKSGSRLLSHYNWVVVDWVSFDEDAPLCSTPYEFRYYYDRDNPGGMCDLFYNFGQFTPVISKLDASNPHYSASTMTTWYKTKYARVQALNNLLFCMDWYVLTGAFDWSKYPNVRVRNCLKWEEDKGNYRYRDYPFALGATPYLYPLLRSGYVHRERYTKGVEKYERLPVAAMDFAAQTNRVLLFGIDDHLKPYYGPGATAGNSNDNHSWAYITSRICILHVAADAEVQLECAAWTFVLVSLEMVDVDAIRDGRKKIKDFDWAIVGGVFYHHIDFTDDAYLWPFGLKLSDARNNSWPLSYAVANRMDIINEPSTNDTQDNAMNYYRIAPLNILSNIDRGLKEGYNWPTGEAISTGLIEYHESPIRQQYFGEEVVNKVAISADEWLGDNSAYLYLMGTYPSCLYSPYMNRMLYQSLSPAQREEHFNILR